VNKSETAGHPARIYRCLREILGRGGRAALATVISRSGSGPREAGASLAVREDGAVLGTIGGGLLEAETLALAHTVLQERRPACRSFFLTGREAAEDGMICGGRMEVLVDYLDGSDSRRTAFLERVVRNLDKGRSCRVVRSIRWKDEKGFVETESGVLDEDGFHAGSLDLSSLDLEKLKNEIAADGPLLIEAGSVRYFAETAADPETVFIFGAGHVGRELAVLMDLIGFRTVILDDRRDFANRARFPMASEIIVLDSYKTGCEGLRITPSSFVVIMTRGHAFDRDVLSTALKTGAGYVGMIASRRKREIIYRSLKEEGFSDETLTAVHSPVGLDIGARTPAEIAVSIAAELIAFRAGKRIRPLSKGGGTPEAE